MANLRTVAGVGIVGTILAVSVWTNGMSVKRYLDRQPVLAETVTKKDVQKPEVKPLVEHTTDMPASTYRWFAPLVDLVDTLSRQSGPTGQ